MAHPQLIQLRHDRDQLQRSITDVQEQQQRLMLSWHLLNVEYQGDGADGLYDELKRINHHFEQQLARQLYLLQQLDELIEYQPE